MTQQNEAELLEHLLKYYSFELTGLTVKDYIAQWRDRYPHHWLRPAIVEALYQGRYKVVSVVQILDMWQRRGQSLCHYNGEFERMICNKFLTLAFSESPLDGAALPIADAPQARVAAEPSGAEPIEASQPAASNNTDAAFHNEPVEYVPIADYPETKAPPAAPPRPLISEAEDLGLQNASLLSSESNGLMVDGSATARHGPEVSLLEEEFLEIFAVESNPFQDDAVPPQAITPFRPSVEVPVAASRFTDDAAEVSPDSLITSTTADIYSKLKSALNRVVSASGDDR